MVAIVSGRGSGRTFHTKALSRHVSKWSEVHASGGHSGGPVVLFIDCAEIDEKADKKIGDFLLTNAGYRGSSKRANKCLDDLGRRLVVVFDGVDKMKTPLDAVKYKIGESSKAKAHVWMSELLKKEQFLVRCSLIVSATPSSWQNLKPLLLKKYPVSD